MNDPGREPFGPSSMDKLMSFEKDRRIIARINELQTELNKLKVLAGAGSVSSLESHFDLRYLRLSGGTVSGPFISYRPGDIVPFRVVGSNAFSSHLSTWETIEGGLGFYVDRLGRPMADDGFNLRNGVVALLGQNADDTTMTGMYDRNELANAALRGVVTVTITGAGTYTNTIAEKNTLFDGVAGAGGFFTITGTDATTTQVVIHVDMLENQNNYFNVFWQPFVQYRLLNSAGFAGTWFKNIVVEVSLDNVSWYRPVNGAWETTDAAADQIAPGYWFGGNGLLPTIFSWRYCRFILSDRQERADYAFKDQVWISEIGLRHMSAPWSRHYLRANGSSIFGDLTFVANGVLSSVYNTIIRQDGSAVFNEQGADVDHRIEGDTDPNLFYLDAGLDAVGLGRVPGTGAKLDVEGHLRDRSITRNPGDISKTNSTIANIAGWAGTAVSGVTYRFHCVMFIDASVAGGHKIDFNGGTATISSIKYHAVAYDSATNALLYSDRAMAAATTHGQTGATEVQVVVEGIVSFSSSGNFRPRFAQNVTSANASTIQADSYLEMRPLN